MVLREYLALLQDVYLGRGCEDEEGALEDAVEQGQQGEHGSHHREPCWVNPSTGFLWFLLTSGFMIAFLLTLLLACQMVLHYSRFGRRHKALYTNWFTSPPSTLSPYMREVYRSASSSTSGSSSSSSPPFSKLSPSSSSSYSSSSSSA